MAMWMASPNSSDPNPVQGSPKLLSFPDEGIDLVGCTINGSVLGRKRNRNRNRNRNRMKFEFCFKIIPFLKKKLLNYQFNTSFKIVSKFVLIGKFCFNSKL